MTSNDNLCLIHSFHIFIDLVSRVMQMRGQEKARRELVSSLAFSDEKIHNIYDLSIEDIKRVLRIRQIQVYAKDSNDKDRLITILKDSY